MNRNSSLTVFSVKREVSFCILLFILISCSFSGSCQQRDSAVLHSQLILSCDNNFFLLNGEDGYYTSGLFLKFQHLNRHTSSTFLKRIFSYEIGQEIYTAHSRKILPSPNNQLKIPGGIEQIDRPIAGYLFGKVKLSTFHKENSIWEVGVSIGSIGKNSQAQSVQEFWHEIIGVKEYWNWVWDYQVKNEVGINLHGSYAHSLLNSKQGTYLQLTPITQATLGTLFTDVSQAVLLQIGKLRPISSSAGWFSRLQTNAIVKEDRPTELFLFYKPEVKYQIYNATIQGGLLSDDKGPILSEVEPFVLSHKMGIQFSVPRFSLGYAITFQSREAQHQFFQQSYGSLVGSFSF